jgi:hypothetical protein
MPAHGRIPGSQTYSDGSVSVSLDAGTGPAIQPQDRAAVHVAGTGVGTFNERRKKRWTGSTLGADEFRMIAVELREALIVTAGGPEPPGRNTEDSGRVRRTSLYCTRQFGRLDDEADIPANPARLVRC